MVSFINLLYVKNWRFTRISWKCTPKSHFFGDFTSVFIEI